MRTNYIIFTTVVFLILLSFYNTTYSQVSGEGEKIVYYQMEPLDDSLFIKIQSEVFIEPPDPKAEIIVDLRDANNQTVSIKGTLYPFLAFTPETRAKIITYPFKINLEETINYGSVFTRVISKIKIRNIFSPPSPTQISSTLGYINPFVQIFGGERFGLPFKKDLGISFGFGTPYSGPLETNFVEADLHLLGVFGGVFSNIEELTQLKKQNNHNNLYTPFGYQVGYTIPLGNFFEFSYLKTVNTPSKEKLQLYHQYDTLGYQAKVLDGGYFNWELRYPIRIFGSTRGKFYVAKYVNELHVGFTGRELSLAGSTFDFRFDGMLNSDIRRPQYVIDILVQRIGENWAFSSFALGPSVVLSTMDNNKFGIITFFFNFRLKVGTSL
ncbi:MAG: hypothetical protein M1480_19750 [Bacteroidetes bacterium]|nr:hypothetical protein [Bacteroidota bacterium]